MGSRRDGAPNEARADRKVRQLCKEVERTLGCALGAASDPVVRALLVVAVDPAPDGARLLVTVAPSTAIDVGAGEIHERLTHVRAYLRDEVAAAINRKRTPELAFHVVPSTIGDEEVT